MLEKIKKSLSETGFSVGVAIFLTNKKIIIYKKTITNEELIKVSKVIDSIIPKSFFFFKNSEKLLGSFFIMDRDFIERAQDVYALELYEYSKNIQMITGENFLNEIKLKKVDLRLAIEREIRGILMKFKTLAIETSFHEKKFTKISHSAKGLIKLAIDVLGDIHEGNIEKFRSELLSFEQKKLSIEEQIKFVDELCNCIDSIDIGDK